ncbi:MAG: hypothetical protein K0M50_00200 [Prolixibacteraceae bacterium]|nr:hypothetical protein [Prolixibacteraceae bacterium]
MKKYNLLLFLFSLISIVSFAQEEATDTVDVKEKDYPVSAVFESGYLIDAQTTVIPEVKTLEFVIQHKFGTIEKGSADLWGIYGSSNIRLGLNFVPIKNLQIGAGITKRQMTTDLNAKWTVLQQTRKNTIPVSVTLYGNMGIDGRNISVFESGEVREAYSGPVGSFKFPDRLNYFSQLIVSRKFNEWLSLQAGVSFTHYNAVGTLYDHDKVGVHFNGRIKVSPQGSIIFNYDEPLKIKQISEQISWTNHPKTNLSFGYEISTGTHAFQIYMGSTQSLLPQDNIMWNQLDMGDKGFAIGFTMTRLWAF